MKQLILFLSLSLCIITNAQTNFQENCQFKLPIDTIGCYTQPKQDLQLEHMPNYCREYLIIGELINNCDTTIKFEKNFILKLSQNTHIPAELPKSLLPHSKFTIAYMVYYNEDNQFSGWIRIIPIPIKKKKKNNFSLYNFE